MTKKDIQIKKAYLAKIKEHGAEKVFLSQCQLFANHFGTKGIYGKENYKKSIAATFQAFMYYELPIPETKLNELLSTDYK